MYYNWEINTSTEELKVVCNLIKNGELVIFPTETVYGIGANALSAEAVGKIFIAKGRPSDNPLIVHVAKKDDIDKIATDITEVEAKLIERFMPGPFTIILKKKKNVLPDIVTAGLDTVAVRMPNNLIAQAIITFSGVPIAAPSANISGRPSGTNISDIRRELESKVSAVIDGGNTEIGLESTVVKVVDEIPIILRPGKITPEEIKETEDLVNKYISDSLDVTASTMNKEDAINSGAECMFIEKYPDVVTVYSIGNVSKELCGGPHVKNTSELGHFKIKKEESSSSGVRRIKAILE